MVERYAHVAPDQLAVAALRLDDLFAGDHLATVGKNQVTAKLPEALQRLVGREGFEPSTNGLRVRCSTN